MRAAHWCGAVATLLLLGACSGDDAPSVPPADGEVVVNDALCLDVDESDLPVVELIGPAIDLLEREYGGPQEFFEISADRQRVSLVVATDDGTAEQFLYCGAAGYVPAAPLGEASGATFGADAVDIDADSVFDALVEELPDPDIVDFAIIGRGDGGAVYDATVQSSSGGVLLVQLSGEGEILGVEAV